MSQSKTLQGRKIAILATDGFEQAELLEPKEKLEAEGAAVEVLSIKDGKIKGWNKSDWGESVDVDRLITDAKPAEFDALVLPGGQMNPDKLRMDEDAVAFVSDFAASGRPVAAICHGPWMLIEAGVVKDRTVTSWPSIKTDLKNAGAKWVDRESVTDGNLVTSRNPKDIPAFVSALTALLDGKMAKAS